MKRILFGITLWSSMMAIISCTGHNDYKALFPAKCGDKWGYINICGEFVIKPQFDCAFEFSEGMARVCVGDKEGFINTKGELVINPQYDNLGDFSEGLALAENDLFGFIDKKV